MPRVTKIGVVTSSKMDKTAVVAVERLVQHWLYKRRFKKTSTFMVHDESNQCQIGDRVRIIECRPMSARKRWRLVEVLESRSRLEQGVNEVAGEKKAGAARLSALLHDYGDAPRTPRRPSGKARGANNIWIYDR